MPPIARLTAYLPRLLCVIPLLTLCAAGCALKPPVDLRYDLGPLQATAQALPLLKLLDINAPPALNSTHMIYRLSYADNQRTAAYANSHWTMTPAQLLTQRLRAALSARDATVLSGVDNVPAPLLKIELNSFEQVFENASESEGVLSARATLIFNDKVLGQHTFTLARKAPSPDAAGGARALAQASDAFAAQLAAWLVSVRASNGQPHP